MYPFKKRKRRGLRNRCPGSGRRGKYAVAFPDGRRRHDVCLICGQTVRVRTYRGTAGTLRLHSLNQPLTWWERVVYWRAR